MQYSQSTGKIRFSDGTYAFGYSGHGEGVNNPSLERVVRVGPLPKGKYKLGTARTHPRLGRFAIPLIPHTSNVMYGRSAFYIHGDNPRGNRSASHGCIILPYAMRLKCARDGTDLEVIE